MAEVFDERKLVKPRFSVLKGDNNRLEIRFPTAQMDEQQYTSPVEALRLMGALAHNVANAVEAVNTASPEVELLGPHYGIRVAMDMNPAAIAAFAHRFTEGFHEDPKLLPVTATTYEKEFREELMGVLKSSGLKAQATAVARELDNVQGGSRAR